MIGKYDSLSRNIRNNKKQANMKTIIDNDDIPEEFKYTLSNNKFLQKDINFGKKRMLIFFNEHDRITIINSTIWLCDGTFKMSPQSFCQIFIVHCSLFDKFLPLIYILLPDKMESTYVTMIEILLNIFGQISLNNLVIDFEKAIRNAFLKTIPSISITHCMFHFGQIIWRKIQNLNLVNLYKNNLNIRFFTKSMMALSFLPCHRIKDAFYKLKNQIMNNKDFNSLYDLIYYFEHNYININNVFWSCHESVIQKIPLTTNICEGWNRALNSSFTSSHPSLITFIIQIRNHSF